MSPRDRHRRIGWGLAASAVACGALVTLFACGDDPVDPAGKDSNPSGESEAGAIAEAGPEPTCRAEDPFGAPSAVPGLDDVALGGVTVAPDELSVFWARSVDGGAEDIFTATRSSRTGAFGAASVVPSVSSDQRDTDPSLSADGLRMYFDSSRDGTLAIWVAARATPNDTFGPAEVVMRFPGGVFQPAIASGGGALYAVAVEADGGAQIVRTNARLRGSPVERVEPLAGPLQESQPTASDDDSVLLAYRGDVEDGGAVVQVVRDGPDGGFGAAKIRTDLPARALPATLTTDLCRLYLLEDGKLVVAERKPR